MSNKVLAPCQRGIVFVLSAPAGTGKTTLVQMLMKEFPNVVSNISYTTRQPRAGEVSGVHYWFVSEEEFQRKLDRNEFLEHAEIYGCRYGTAYHSVEEQVAQGKHLFLVIDTQGALQLKGRLPCVFVFLEPPSLQELRLRLTSRQTESDLVIEERLAWAKKELPFMREYDYRIVNDDLAIAYQVLRSILIAETHRIKKSYF